MCGIKEFSESDRVLRVMIVSVSILIVMPANSSTGSVVARASAL
ncbi:hypothetical protein [Turneriella parva]|nr:hypothetical protein [Turneriella parva]